MRIARPFRGALLPVVALLAGLPAGADAQCDVTRLVAPTPQPDPFFGMDVALHDGTALVGNGQYFFGQAPSYVYEHAPDGWTQPPQALPPDGYMVIYGTSVDVWGDTAVVAAQDEDDADVMAYVFERLAGTWTKSTKLEVPLSSWQHGDGLRVAIEQDTIVVANLYNFAAHVFERGDGSWPLAQTLQPTSPPGGSGFGWSVSLRGDRVVIGGCAEDMGLSCVGTAWVFERQAGVWTETQQLVTTGGEEYDNAGWAVALSDDTIVLGAPAHDLGFINLNIGAAFVFELQAGTWVQTAFLTAPEPKVDDGFGMSLALQDDALLVGAPRRDDGVLNSGAVYVFHRSGTAWEPAATLHAAEPVEHGNYGSALALEGDTLLVGAPFYAQTRDDGVYVVRGATGAAHWTPVWGAVEGTTGTPCSSGHGAPAVGGAASLALTGALPGAPAWLVLSFDRINAPFKGGVLVPAPDLLLPFAVDAAGGHALPWTWPVGLPSGVELWMQHWIVDGGATAGMSASNGLSVDVP